MMKRLTTMITILLVVGLLLTGCGNSGAPKYSSDDVQKMVIEIATEQLRNNLIKRVLSARVHE